MGLLEARWGVIPEVTGIGHLAQVEMVDLIRSKEGPFERASETELVRHVDGEQEAFRSQLGADLFETDPCLGWAKMIQWAKKQHCVKAVVGVRRQVYRVDDVHARNVAAHLGR